MRKLLLLLTVVLASCECPFAELQESESDYYRRTGYDLLTAQKLVGVWQCYHPMFVGNTEFKSVRIFDDGVADITIEDKGDPDYYTLSFKYAYTGKYITFSRGRTVYQFRIKGYLYPELYLEDSFGTYTWAKRG